MAELMRKLMYRQVFLLVCAQALFQTASVMVMAIGALAGSRIAPEAHLATAPVAGMMLGTALATVPASLIMQRWGRRSGFLLGALAGVLGGLTAALGISQGSLWLLSAGTMLVGMYQGFAQFYRFAAAEVADEAFRPRAISWVLAGGVVAALSGPALGRLGGPLLGAEFAGSFLLLAVVSLLAMGVLLALKFPPVPKAAAGDEPPRPLGQIMRQPVFLVAFFGAATGYGVMILAMTATPLAMQHHHHDLSASTLVIQSHVLAMFLPSFFTGSLIARFGALQIMAAGVALLTGHILLSLSGTDFVSFLSALIFLGVGWNFLFIGGTSLLTRTYRPSERAKAQAANDLSIFILGLLASLGAGGLLAAVGWQQLNLLLLPWLGLAALAMLTLAVGQRRGSAPHPARGTAP